MTPFRIVVSWLAFSISCLAGLWIGWNLLSGLFTAAGGIIQGKGFRLGLPDNGWWLVESLVLAVLALAVIAPWLIRLIPGTLEKPPINRWLTEGSADKLNIAGRWLQALALLLVDGLLPFGAILSAILIGPELVQWVAMGPMALIDAVFFPGGREARPPYSLKLARYYTVEKRWEEAEEEYARMLSFYPDRLEAWQERLELASRRGIAVKPDPEDVLASGLKSLDTAADRESLYQSFTRAGGITIPRDLTG